MRQQKGRGRGWGYHAIALWALALLLIPASPAHADIRDVVIATYIIGVILIFVGLVPPLARSLVAAAKSSTRRESQRPTQDVRVNRIAEDLFPDEEALPPSTALSSEYFLNKRLPPGESTAAFAMEVFEKHGVYLPESYADRVFQKEINQPFFRRDGQIRRTENEGVGYEQVMRRRRQNLKQTVRDGVAWVEKLVQNHHDEVEKSAEQSARGFLLRLSRAMRERDPVGEAERLLRNDWLAPQERYVQDVNFFRLWLQTFEKAVFRSRLMQQQGDQVVGGRPGGADRVHTRIREIIAEYSEISANRCRLQKLSAKGRDWDKAIYQASTTQGEVFDRESLLAFQKVFLECEEPFRRLLESVDLEDLSVENLNGLFLEHDIFPQRIVILGNRPIVATMVAQQYNHDLGSFAIPLLRVEECGREEPEGEIPADRSRRQENAEKLKHALGAAIEKAPTSQLNEMLRVVFEHDEGPVDKLGRYILVLPVSRQLSYEDELVLGANRFFPPSGLDQTLTAVVNFADTDPAWNSDQAAREDRLAAYEFFLSAVTVRPPA
jgi:hypothetical protein